MAKPKEAPTLVEFYLAKKREGCRVCALPEDVMEQMRQAKSRKIQRALQLEWLAKLGYKLTVRDLDSHYSGRHDQEVL